MYYLNVLNRPLFKYLFVFIYVHRLVSSVRIPCTLDCWVFSPSKLTVGQWLTYYFYSKSLKIRFGSLFSLSIASEDSQLYRLTFYNPTFSSRFCFSLFKLHNWKCFSPLCLSFKFKHSMKGRPQLNGKYLSLNWVGIDNKYQFSVFTLNVSPYSVKIWNVV